ncbi:hypothetical protein [Pseudoalteromonas rubra]|uniref:hypothetical protein n=1 Tax=Pseudoalteromonas rubra TaxID=43658 RepID=UPI002DB663E3|nr:hypothetical protein [Pseudoalteromonas rubra]MEC4090115.1 hypothetical protein [Pseudoalteromonas rubra]
MSDSVSWLEIISIVSSIVSVIIGGFAIWLAVKFYEMSNKSAEKLEKASSNIEATNKRLETLFDKLYSDTFAMVKDTVSDMRNHVWRNDQQTDESENNISHLKEELRSEFQKGLEQAASKNDIKQMHAKVNELIDSTVEKVSYATKQPEVEYVFETIKNQIADEGYTTPAKLKSELDMTSRRISLALFRLRKDGKINWSGSSNQIWSDSHIDISEETP